MIHSPIFKFEQLKSELRGTQWTLAILVIAFLIYFARWFIFGASEDREMFGLSAALFGMAISYEFGRLVYLRRKNAARLLPPKWVAYFDTMIEAMFPTFILLMLTIFTTAGPYSALIYPIRALNFFAILLSVMQLNPACSLFSGVLAATSHASLVLWTFHRYPVEQYPSAPFPAAPPYLTYALMIFLFGLVAAALARELRRSVATALSEMQERQRIQLISRNTLIFGLAKLAEYRDTDTGAHLERISLYSEILGRALRSNIPEITDDWIEELKVASSMHDIGKVGIPDGVLLKRGLLTEDERKVIQKHPRLGEDALQAILNRHGSDTLLEMSAAITIGHHERWDGKGYPNGLVAENIPLAARIISVADVYDALTSKRVYKPALSHVEAVEIICNAGGTQFDPMVVEAFIRSLKEFDETRERFCER